MESLKTIRFLINANVQYFLKIFIDTEKKYNFRQLFIDKIFVVL